MPTVFLFCIAVLVPPCVQAHTREVALLLAKLHSFSVNEGFSKAQKATACAECWGAAGVDNSHC